jgi:hypothetical protein
MIVVTRRPTRSRHARNRRLADALYQQAFGALQSSPEARRYYDTPGAVAATRPRALRNRFAGILHGCLEHQTVYNEDIAWPQRSS